VYAFILCLRCPMFRSRPCDELITRPRSPTICKNVHETEKSALCNTVGARERKKYSKHFIQNTHLIPVFKKLKNCFWI
jgi:hypothetical protein